MFCNSSKTPHSVSDKKYPQNKEPGTLYELLNAISVMCLFLKKARRLLATVDSKNIYTALKKGKQNQKKLTLIYICIVSFSFCGFRYFS